MERRDGPQERGGTYYARGAQSRGKQRARRAAETVVAHLSFWPFPAPARGGSKRRGSWWTTNVPSGRIGTSAIARRSARSSQDIGARLGITGDGDGEVFGVAPKPKYRPPQNP